jgi:hypothetical protein
MRKTLSILALALSITSGVSEASTMSAQTLDYFPTIIQEAAQSEGIPVLYFYSLAAKESTTKLENGQRRPWPYTINYRGKGYRFASYDDLLSACRSLLGKGITNFDVGFFQVNYKWNKDRFDTLEELAHPVTNAQLAAEIFREHYDTYRNWYVAAGRYHNPSNTNGRATQYENEYRKYVELVRNGKY